MNTGNIANWDGNMMDIGPIYPFVDGRAQWSSSPSSSGSGWHYLQIQMENRMLESEAQKLRQGDNLQKAIAAEHSPDACRPHRRRAGDAGGNAGVRPVPVCCAAAASGHSGQAVRLDRADEGCQCRRSGGVRRRSRAIPPHATSGSVIGRVSNPAHDRRIDRHEADSQSAPPPSPGSNPRSSRSCTHSAAFAPEASRASFSRSKYSAIRADDGTLAVHVGHPHRIHLLSGDRAQINGKRSR